MGLRRRRRSCQSSETAVKEMEVAVKDPWYLLEERRGFSMPMHGSCSEIQRQKPRHTITGKLPWL